MKFDLKIYLAFGPLYWFKGRCHKAISMKNENETPRSYTLRFDGRGKISSAFCKLCAVGQVGEHLIRHGCNQGQFNLFLARLAIAHVGAGKTEIQLAEVFEIVSGGNASAARQAIGELALKWEGAEKEMSVETHWKSLGGGTTSPNLSILDL